MGTSELYNLYDRAILPSIEFAAAGGFKQDTIDGLGVVVADFDENILRYKIISDTVIFYTNGDDVSSFIAIAQASCEILSSGFNGLNYPFRGAIGYGDLIDDGEDILVGSALEDAYAGEEIQAWAGVMLTEKCRDFVLAERLIDMRKQIFLKAAENFPKALSPERASLLCKMLVKYRVPIKKDPKSWFRKYGVLETYAIDWTVRSTASSESSFGQPKAKHPKTIKMNTMKFEKWAREHNRRDT